MKEHLSSKQIENLVQRRSAPEDLLLHTRHLATCEICRPALEKRFRSERPMRERVSILRAELAPRKDPSTPHLSYDQVTGYVDEKLGETTRAIVEQHLALCAQCSFETVELRRLRDTLDRDAAKKSVALARRPATVAPAVIHSSQSSRPSGPAASNASNQRWRRPMSWALAGGLTVVLLGAELWMSQVKTGLGAKKLLVQAPTPAKIVTKPTAVPPTVRPSRTEQGATPLALIDHDHQIQLDREGKLTGLPDLPESLARDVKQLFTSQRPEIPVGELQSLRSRQATLMSGAPKSEAPSIKLLKPVGVITIEDQPTFHWLSVTGAQQYTVTVLDTDFNPVLSSGPQSETHWRPARPLPRNRTYVWQVTAEINGQRVSSSSASAAEARFKLLSAEQARQLRRTAEQYRDSHLILGMLYAQAGLIDDATREFQALATANPQSPLPQKLLRQMRVRLAN